jgi:hypothetical protein
MAKLSQDQGQPSDQSRSVKPHARPRSESTLDGRASKYVQVDSCSENNAKVNCFLPPHQPLDFETFDDYEIHYNQHHINRCLTCQKNFPSDHYLGLHIAENHDPINEAKKERGDKTVAPPYRYLDSRVNLLTEYSLLAS